MSVATFVQMMKDNESFCKDCASLCKDHANFREDHAGFRKDCFYHIYNLLIYIAFAGKHKALIFQRLPLKRNASLSGCSVGGCAGKSCESCFSSVHYNDYYLARRYELFLKIQTKMQTNGKNAAVFAGIYSQLSETEEKFCRFLG
jgi:hypothetical protein